ncbi:MoxR family ATPase [Nakamurella flavida]|uniref:MoxR family ATPase n=1 Tax=Nakamurella flavida TaxID=363630 RepID=A0A938YMG1_9ACTN|nr:MoxR family ATPase [Nakamurella flavida]MBM9475600.1 MoxR family ATPase [Nakamurella flavida]MDP9778124.1 MoxR-like ATPase [Nakamurella flavida]
MSAAAPDDPFGSPAALSAALTGAGYLSDPGLSTVAYLAQALSRPLFLEGEAGVGKTALALALAELRGVEVIRLQCYEGIDASQALYDWDFPRQILHLRAVEAVAATTAGTRDGSAGRLAEIEADLYGERFLIARPILTALRTPRAVLLIDEIDRADDEFEAFLLEVLSEFAVTIPELGRIRAVEPPLVVLTSNRTREVHDALKRRCLYHWVEHPSLDREVEILRLRLPQITEALATGVATAVGRLREAELIKPPGVAESLDWARALHALGCDRLDPESAAVTLGAVLKYREDTERVTAAGVAALFPVA